MARRQRVEYSGAVYHVLARGNDRQEIFGVDALRHRFLETLGEACEQTSWWVHAYVLMGNHYHLLLETPEANLVAGMKWLQGTYTQRFNKATGRCGHLFQGRYKSLVMDPEDAEYVRGVSTYIHLNPFRAGLCGVGLRLPLERYGWSSYPLYLQPRGRRPVWLRIERVLESLGIGGVEKRDRERYRGRVEARMRHENDPDNHELLAEDRQSLRQGWCLGRSSFRREMLALLSETSGDNLRGDQRREHGEAAAERLYRVGLNRFGLEDEAVRSRKSTDPEKQALAWLLKKHTTVTGVWIAERLSMGHRVNASRAISRFDQAADRMTRRLRDQMLQCTG